MTKHDDKRDERDERRADRTQEKDLRAYVKRQPEATRTKLREVLHRRGILGGGGKDKGE